MTSAANKKYIARFTHKIAPRDTDVSKESFEIADNAFSDSRTLGAALRAARVLQPGERVRTFRVEGDKVIIFPPKTSIWHAITIFPAEPKIDSLRFLTNT